MLATRHGCTPDIRPGADWRLCTGHKADGCKSLSGPTSGLEIGISK